MNCKRLSLKEQSLHDFYLSHIISTGEVDFSLSISQDGIASVKR